MSLLRSDGQFAPGDARGLSGPLCPDPIDPGERMPYSCVTGGTFTVAQAFAAISVGVLPWLTADLVVPVVLHAEFADDLGFTRARGAGDVVVGLRIGGVWDSWAVAGVAQVKAPTGPRRFQYRDVPLGEGIWEAEAGVRAGRSFGRWGWAEVHQGLRLRFVNPSTGTDAGEEWTGKIGGGVSPLPKAGFLADVSWVVALPDHTAFGTRVPGRRLVQARVGPFLRPADGWWVETTLTLPLAGRRWPTGATVAAAVAGRVVLWRASPGANATERATENPGHGGERRTSGRLGP